MRKMSLMTQIAFIVLTVGSAIAQTTVLSPVPFLRPGGNIPIGMPDTGVYLDVQGAQALIFYRPADGRVVRRLAVPLGNGIRATVSSRVEQQGANYVYTYQINNDATAAQAIVRLELNDPALGRAIVVESPTQTVPPNSAGEFRLVAARKPGLVRAVARGKTTDVDLPSDLPAGMKAELDSLRRTSIIDTVAFVFGPRFEANTDRLQIAKEYLAAAGMLVKLQQLDRDSLYMQGILNALTNEDGLSSSLRLAAGPATKREIEFDQALRAALP